MTEAIPTLSHKTCSAQLQNSRFSDYAVGLKVRGSNLVRRNSFSFSCLLPSAAV